MNVADLNPDDNPNSPTIETPEQLCQQIDQFAQTLKTKVRQAAHSGDSFDSVEREIHKMILSVGRQAVDLFVRLQGDGDLGEELTTQDGVTLHRSPSKAMSTIRSIFGTHCFEQFIYAPGPKKPSPCVPSVLACLCRRTVGRTCCNNGRSESKLMVATADCKGVLLVKADAAKVAAFETAKKNPGNRRMATFGPRTVPILDIVHALAYLWEAAGLFEKDEDRRRAFTRERLLRILRGESQGVIKGLRLLGTTRELKGEAAKDLARICGYLEKHSDRMKYDEYLRCG